MTDDQLPASNAIQSVVHSYTQAELALAEITGAAERFRSASEQLATAAAQYAEAVQALRTATTASLEVAERLDAVVQELGNATAALRAVDPDRLWSHLEAEKARHVAVADGQLHQTLQLRWFAGGAALGAAISALLLVALAIGVVPLE